MPGHASRSYPEAVADQIQNADADAHSRMHSGGRAAGRHCRNSAGFKHGTVSSAGHFRQKPQFHVVEIS